MESCSRSSSRVFGIAVTAYALCSAVYCHAFQAPGSSSGSHGDLLTNVPLVITSGGSSEPLELANDPPKFAMYMLATTWLPEFCYHQPFPGCQDPLAQWNISSTIHGLWPEYSTEDGGSTSSPGPQNCKSGTFSQSELERREGVDVRDLWTSWPNVKSADKPPAGSSEFNGRLRRLHHPSSSSSETSTSTQLYYSFWEYEWDKHGSCSGLSQSDYFYEALSLYKRFPTPTLLSTNVGGAVSRKALEDAFGGAELVSLQCRGSPLRRHLTVGDNDDHKSLSSVTDGDGADTSSSTSASASVATDDAARSPVQEQQGRESGLYLSEIRTCWRRKADGRVGDRIPCPSFVRSTCAGGTEVIISGFPTTAAVTINTQS